MTTSSSLTDTVSQISNSNLLLHGDAIGSKDWTGIFDDDEFSSVAVEEKEDLEQPEPPSKRARPEEILRVESKPIILPVVSTLLPEPCPIPTVFSEKVTEAIEKKQVNGNIKLALIREAAVFYYGICPNPSQTQYDTMSRTLCDNFQDLKNKVVVDDCYWVSLHTLLRTFTYNYS